MRLFIVAGSLMQQLQAGIVMTLTRLEQAQSTEATPHHKLQH